MLGLPRDHETYEYALLQLLDVLSLYLCLSDWEAGPERASVRVPHAPGAAESTLIVTAPTGLVVYGWSRGPSPAVGCDLRCVAGGSPPSASPASLRAVWQRTAPELVPSS